MGQTIAKAVRLQIVKELESGKSRQQIAADLKVGYSSIRRFYTAYKAGGEAALDNAYANCEPKDIKFDPLIYRSCYLLATFASGLGGGLYFDKNTTTI